MGVFATRGVGLSGPSAPPNAEYLSYKNRYKGHGSPEGLVFGRIGDSYLDLDTGTEWSKITDDLLKTGWDQESNAESEFVATGGTASRTGADRAGDSKNVKEFGVVADGTTDDYARLVVALAASNVLRITGVIRIGTNLTIPAANVLIFEKGGKLKPSSGVKIIVNGEIQAGRFEIFDYTAGGKCCLGIFTVAKTTFVFPEWYGASANNSTNNDTAFSRIFDTSFNAGVENYQPVILATGYYNFIAGFTVRSQSIVRGEMSRKTRLQISPAAGSGTARLITIPVGSDNISISGVQFNVLTFPAGVRTIGVGHANATDHASTLSIRDCVFNNFNQYAIDIGEAIYFEMLSTEFADISNRTSFGGTGDTPARCVNVQTFAHGVTITGQTKCVNCDSFIKTPSSASLTFSDGDFEQTGAGGLEVDAITNKGHFMYLSGRNIRIANNYSEGIRATSPDAVIYFQDCENYEVSQNYMHGFRAGGSSSVSQIFVSVGTGCKGGAVRGNYFGGTPVKYITVNSSSHVPICEQNTFVDDTGTSINSYDSIKPYLTPVSMDFSTNSGRFFTRPTFFRSITGSAGVLFPLTIGRNKNTGAGAAGDGAGVKFEGTKDNASDDTAGSLYFEYISAANGADVTDFVLKARSSGSDVESMRLRGLGGMAIRGGAHGVPRSTAISSSVAQSDATIVVTASGTTQTIVESGGLPLGKRFTFVLKIGGAGTGTVAFTNSSDRIQPSAAATYSLSADGKHVTLELVAANTWIIVANN